MQVALVRDILLIYTVRKYALRAEPMMDGSVYAHCKQYNAHAPPAQQPHKLALELGGEVRDVLPRVLADNKHLPEVGLGLGMALEAVLVSTLLLADLTVPSETLKSLGLHFVGDIFGCSDCKIWLNFWYIIHNSYSYLQLEAS